MNFTVFLRQLYFWHSVCADFNQRYFLEMKSQSYCMGASNMECRHKNKYNTTTPYKSRILCVIDLGVIGHQLVHVCLKYGKVG